MVGDIVAAVNRTSAIRELSTNTASVDVLSMPALPKLSATVNLRRDRDFRMRARLPVVMGSGLDIGSNQDLFWFEVPENFSRTLYYARHDQYQRQLNRAILPVDPTWLIDSLGLAQINPNQIDQPLQYTGDGKLVLQTAVPMAAGTFRRIYMIDAAGGHVIDQFVYSPAGQLIAESHASNHEFFAEHGCSLPHTVRFKLTPAAGDPLEMQVDIGMYAINQILSGDPNLFVIPQGAANAVDLTTISPLAMPPTTAALQPVNYQQELTVGYQPELPNSPQFRGM
ncbi:hypothetical protein CGZ80_02015 [Rhodopirellula sp. MGV]|nr:hypothetical protein CGZ80_02015 [Rhodopirellula sp. MGV]PNY34812.1 hypothetical protein C2E31_21430 [Rhodopirellula baltica]